MAADAADTVVSPSPVPYRAGEAFPAVLSLCQMAGILGVSYSRARHLQAEGQLERFETALRIGGRVRYSGVKVQQWAEDRVPAAHESTGRHWGGQHR